MKWSAWRRASLHDIIAVPVIRVSTTLGDLDPVFNEQ
jgi:hypothetical protein